MNEIEPAFRRAIIEEHTDSDDDYTTHFTDIVFERETERTSAKFSMFHSYREPRGNEEIEALNNDLDGDNVLDDNTLDDSE